MRLQNLAASLAFVLATPIALAAQGGIAARASTLGAGAEVSFRATRMIGVRIGGNYLEFSRDATIEDIAYHVTPHFESGTAILDLYPLGGSFHLSGGVLFNRNQGELVARLAHDVQIGNQTYTPEQVGSLTGTLTFKRSAPYVGLGFAGRSRIALLFDLGVGITGQPQMTLVGQTNLTGQEKAEFDANVAREQDRVQAEITKHKFLKFHPVVSLGLKFGF
jgi:hypothetical protein